MRVSPDGLIEAANEAFSQIVGYRATELVAMRERDLTPETWHAFEDRVIRPQLLNAASSEVYDKEYRHKDGHPVPVSVRWFLDRDRANTPLYIWGIVQNTVGRRQIGRTLTATRNTLAATNSLLGVGADERKPPVVSPLASHPSTRLIDAQEAERARLARELHDGISQQIAVLAFDVDRLMQTTPAPPSELLARFKNLRDQVRTLAADVHRLTHGLHPARLDRLGFSGAVQALCRDMSDAHTIGIEFRAAQVPELDRAAALALYRIIQEALRNVARHSGASHATVEVLTFDHELRITISDDGHGFPPHTAQSRVSFGIANMRDRVRALCGQLVVTTKAEGGTTVDVHVPLGVDDPE